MHLKKKAKDSSPCLGVFGWVLRADALYTLTADPAGFEPGFLAVVPL